jgi:hypothetical protein
MAEAVVRPKVLVIGPVPPPAFGVAQATRLMLDSPALTKRLDIIHLDTSDVHGFASMGRLDCHNILLALEHLGRLTRLLIKRSPDVVMLTACSSRSVERFALVRSRISEAAATPR